MKVYTQRQARQSKLNSIISHAPSPAPVHSEKVCPTCNRAWPKFDFNESKLNEEYIEELRMHGEKRQKTSFRPIETNIEAIKKEL